MPKTKNNYCKLNSSTLFYFSRNQSFSDWMSQSMTSGHSKKGLR